MSDGSETINVPFTLDKKELDILRQIRDKVNKEGNNWSFAQILQELAAISLHNWSKMQFLSTLTPKQDGFDV